MTRFVAYTRVSTADQGKSGLGLEAQAEAISRFIAFDDFNLIETYTDIASGKDNNRPQLKAAMERCKKEKATLIVAKLDRLARNAKFLLEILDSGVPIQFCDFPDIQDNSMGRLMVTIMAGVAEWESGVISERTKAALKAAKANGVKLGTAGVERARLNKDKAQKVANALKPRILKLHKAGIRKPAAIADQLNTAQIPGSRGGKWHPTSVRRLLNRLELK